MIRVNRQFFVVKIDKKLQEEKRGYMVKKDIGFLGIKHSKQDGDAKIKGVRVWDVEKNSPAYDAAFKHNDIIIAINSIKVYSYDDLQTEVSKHGPGDTIEISYINSFSKDGREVRKKNVKLATRKFEVVMPPHQVDFQSNLQFGEIVSAGSIAKEQFPEAQVGDILIFHHGVEHKPRTENEPNYHDYHLIETDEGGDEYRVVNFTNELFGVLKLEEGIIIPYNKFVFCHFNIKKASIQKSKSGLWLPDQWLLTSEEINQKLEKLKEDIASITSSTVMKQRTNNKNYKSQNEIKRAVDSINRERALLTKKMGQRQYVEVTVLFIHPDTNTELGTNIQAGDTILADYGTLYPLDMMGRQYTLVRKEYIEAIIHNN